MRDRSSSSDAPAGPTWHQVRIWWPVECVPVKLEIAHPRKLTALEWAVLRVMDEFRDAPPSLQEVAHQLGIEDPSFLVDATNETVRLRALAPRDDEVSPRDLPDLDFTPLGFELYQRGQIEAEPAEHGETLYFDALTDEAVPVPKPLENWPETPFPSTQPVPEARETVGLDRAREIVRRLHPDLLRGDGEVRSVVPQSGDWPRVAWRPVDLELRIGRDVGVVVTAKGLSRAASTFLGASDLVAEGILPARAISETWAHEGGPRCSSQLDHAGWNALVDRTLPISAVEPEAMRLLGQARDEVVVHSVWLALGQVRERLHALATDGRRVLVVNGEETVCFALAERPRPGIGLSIQVDAPVVGAMVIDGRSGVLLDDVTVRVGDSLATIELAGLLSRDGARRCRAAMLTEITRCYPTTPHRPARPIQLVDLPESAQASADRALQDAELRLALGSLAARQDAAAFENVVRVAAQLAPGVDRVALLVRVAGFGRAFAPDLTPEDLLAPAIREWRAAVALLAVAGDILQSAEVLARLAPDGVEAEELVSSATAAGITSTRGDPPQQTGAFLEGVRTAADARWGRAAALRCRAWTDERDRVLAPSNWSLDSLHEAAAVGSLLLERNEQGRWAEALITALPEPACAQEWGAWVDGVAHLREMAPEAAEQATHRVWVELVEAWPEERKTLLRLAQGVVPGQEVAAHLLRSADSLAEVDRVRRLLLEANYPDDGAWWGRQFESMLPDPETVHTTSTLTELVRELGRLDREGPTSGLGQAWAACIADQIPAPSIAEGIPWWLNEMVPLRPILAGVEQRAVRVVRSFRGQLRSAKTGGDALWFDCLHAWQDLGIPGSALDDLVDKTNPRERDTSESPPNGGRKGKKRRRR